MRRRRRFRVVLAVYIVLFLIVVLFFRTFRYQYFGPTLCLDRLTGEVYRYNPVTKKWEPEQSVDYLTKSLADWVTRQQRKPSPPQRDFHAIPTPRPPLAGDNSQ